ncbi:uncharacterized protein EV422DRAFT_318944 [Fimicolochytrium jonesii]|uniref:uncharacterized protein n=1 Tax=Fimicolochytrium jonesii TaxID=1396493 RepID=UPI0022FEC33C|nr:uncharacterized protein EV422DRAFT_318944 [Fimicolochytrium jonesii]KAI8824390.1 hypothetical protein EV422DRAFT_318944 [Fimicolochytrium jonesii]
MMLSNPSLPDTADLEMLPTGPMLRIKRKRNEDPIDAFIVATEEIARKEKRTKTGEEPPAEIARFFQRVETVETRDFDDTTRLKATSERLKYLRANKQSIKSPPPSPSDERRAEAINGRNAERKAARYRVVKDRRQILDDVELLDVEETSDEPKKGPHTTSYESGPIPESDLMESLMPMMREYLHVSQEKDGPIPSEYVYDIYYAQPEMDPEAHSRVAELTFEDLSATLLADAGDSSDNNDDDDEDSNAEDYYANEYPDASDSEKSDDSDVDEGYRRGRGYKNYFDDDEDDDGDYDPYDS